MKANSRPCPVCGKPMHRQSNICRACYMGKHRRPENYIYKICPVCGKLFEKYNAEIRRTKHGLHFCSLECWYEHNQLENHAEWTGGQDERNNPEAYRWRKAVLARDKYYCRLCHSQERLEAHHIIPFGVSVEHRWDVTNGITLCRKCHIAVRGEEQEYEEILHFVALIPLEVWCV